MKNNIISTYIILSRFNSDDITISDIIRTKSNFEFRVQDNKTKISYFFVYDNKQDKLKIVDYDEGLLSIYDKNIGIKSKLAKLTIDDIQSRLHQDWINKVKHIFSENNYNSLILDELERLDYIKVNQSIGSYSLYVDPKDDINFDDVYFVRDCLNQIVENYSLYYSIFYNGSAHIISYTLHHIKEYIEDWYYKTHSINLKQYLNEKTKHISI